MCIDLCVDLCVLMCVLVWVAVCASAVFGERGEIKEGWRGGEMD